MIIEPNATKNVTLSQANLIGKNDKVEVVVDKHGQS